MGLEDAIQRARNAEKSALSAQEQLSVWRAEREQRLRALLEEFVRRCRRDGIAAEPIARLKWTKKHGGVYVWDGVETEAWAIFHLSDGEGGSAGAVYVTGQAELVKARTVVNDMVTGWPFSHRRVLGVPGNLPTFLADKSVYEPWGMTLGDGWLEAAADPGFPERLEASTQGVLEHLEDSMGVFLAARIAK